MNPFLEGKRALICFLKNNPHDHVIYKLKLEELKTLVKSLNIEIVDNVIQTRIKPASNYCFGKGRVLAVKERVNAENIDLIIFYNRLNSKQRLNLNRVLERPVLDRNDIVFELFRRGASDKLSVLQIEYAEISRMLPYYKLIVKEKFMSDRAFLGSSGEYGYHNTLKAYTRKLCKIKEEMDAYFQDKLSQIEKRKALNKPTVCISGYYNAGKTTLFNFLTGESKEVSDRPFTTLVSKYQIGKSDKDIFFIDTIGFVADMDLNVLKSFSLNMLDIINADLILFTVSLDDELEAIKFKIQQGFEIYRDLQIDFDKILLVFTKIDLLDEDVFEEYKSSLAELYSPDKTVFISVFSGAGLNKLMEKIKLNLKPQANPVRIF
ncbi:MAG: 50S ribosome-binding GTPase [Candidatus Odinarchaeum yellowstonii]|uniref:50S ribosome-binding GTPase n=1 Tax=Odinarchaeota yellowstonii (strain LCB_4) TaxID=1841599 RepID=A0AAF0D2C5_ODILC|nr:MAG: 50S ribosome-binding GTPase [Candidatus Odinarchaeum yellowstonii]